MTDATNALLLLLNGLVTGASCLRLLCYRRLGATFCRGKSLLAYALIVTTGTVSLRCFFGLYHGEVDFAEFAINVVLAVAIFRVRGNVAGLFRPARHPNGGP
ncbi:phage holin family protein [Pandoraea sp.]|uniref:phage holin family protein n=1 Tax=Pandoraea sp. TaxID=1883445 RepID=UPI0025DE94C0|nr:phage holin family protein [Pandoraea sp.]